jgi:hypothetical protein
MPYRDDSDGRDARRIELEHELDEILRTRNDLEALRRRETAVRTELEELKARSRFASAKRLPLLDRVYVASPCSAKWDDMVGNERVRFCGQCAKNVYDLSAMSRAAAEQLVREKEGDVCVRFHRRTDGTIMTADCPVGVRRRRIRRVAATAITAAAAASAAAGILAHSSEGAAPEFVAGGIASSPAHSDTAQPEFVAGTMSIDEPAPTETATIAPTGTPRHVRMGKPSIAPKQRPVKR